MRLDLYMVSAGMCKSRTKAKEHIECGRVKVNSKTVFKAGFDVDADDLVEFEEPGDEYVGRGAHKLVGALSEFGIDVTERKCIDVGASTGGFTDVLLRCGAKSVTCVDSGHGQLDERLVHDARVTNIEGCNARYMTADEVGDGYAIAVMDVSFISQTYIFPALLPLIAEDGVLISLVKPQFELDSASVGKGVVKNPTKRLDALLRVYESLTPYGFCVLDATISKIKGGDGNTEYLFLIGRGEQLPHVKDKLKGLSRN